MIDFEQVREQAFLELSKTFSVNKVTTTKKTKIGSTKNIEQWRVILEVPLTDKVKDFVIYVELKGDFPLSIPVIYLSEEDYNDTKYIPHVDDQRNICLFDQENIKLDIDRPAEIIRACLKKAGQILADGITGKNTGDFRDEVVAYWTNVYHTNDQVFEAYLGEGVELLSPGVYNGSLLSPSFAGVDFFMDADTTESKKVIDFFKLSGHKIKEQPFYYLGSVASLIPPFYFTGRQLIAFLRDNFKADWAQIKRYLNQDFGAKVFCFSVKVDHEMLFFGFNVSSLPAKIKGWRSSSLTTLSFLESVQPTRAVSRIAFKYFSQARLQKRTDGITGVVEPKKMMFAGLGSIGSNLSFYLSNLEITDIVLCDPDILALENINRHLLSFNDVGSYKVERLAKYLTFNNPFLNVSIRQTSFVEVMQKELALINSMDIIFCAIGKDSIENYILQYLANGQITKPVMLFWVEPYLLGGHALYITPSSGFSLKNLEDNGYYRYNMIALETYADPKYRLLLREAGCQGSYVPYGKAAIAIFFANLIPHLFAIINELPKQNKVFSYLGDPAIAVKNGVTLSDFAKKMNSNQIEINLI